MGTIANVFFLTLLNWIHVNADTSIIYTASDIEESHKSILADINYQLELNRAIPGKPNQDYPIHSTVPKTTFSCNDKLEGYYADTESRCQAFRICTNTAPSTQGFGFLCPNGTLFSQKILVCDWYRNVKCNDSEVYYNNNIKVGTEFDIMKTIRLMMEYPIKMLKGDYNSYIEEPYTELKSSTTQENYTQNFYDYESPNQNNKSSLLINNLGELSSDNSISFVENGTTPTNSFQSSTVSEINLALNINNLAETKEINGTIDNDSDTINKQPFRFLSQEFSSKKIQNKEMYEKINQTIYLNSLHDNDQLKYSTNDSKTESVGHFNGDHYTAKNVDNSKLDAEYDFKTALEINNSNQHISTNENSSTDAAKYDKLKGNSEYLQKFSSNLLISGIIQTKIEPKVHEYNATVKTNKLFKNFFTKRNFQQSFIKTPKMSSTTTTKNPRFHYKQTVQTRLQPLISQKTSTMEKSEIEHYSISKKSIRNSNTARANLSNIINHGSDLTYQPTLESVQKNLMRYKVFNGDSSKISGRVYPNRKKIPPPYIVTTNKENPTLTSDSNTMDSFFNIPTYRNSFMLNDDSNKTNNSSNGEFYLQSSIDSFLSQRDPSSNILQPHLNKGISSGFSQDSFIAGAEENPISGLFKNSNNMKSESSQKNYISLKEFFNRKFGDKSYI